MQYLVSTNWRTHSPEGKPSGERGRAIHSVHWAEIHREAPGQRWLPDGGRGLVLWPAPIDHDACIAAAGFSDFADSNERWDEEFSDLVRSLLASLESAGPPRLERGEDPVHVRIFEIARRVVGGQRGLPNALDALIAAARDDTLPPCVVRFGDPVGAIVRTCHGHPLLWVWLAASGPEREELLRSVSSGRPLLNTTLAWEAL